MRGQPHGPLPRFVYVPMGAPQGQGHDEKNKVRSSCRGSRSRLPGEAGYPFNQTQANPYRLPTLLQTKTSP